MIALLQCSTASAVLLVGIWFGYAGVIAGLARLRPASKFRRHTGPDLPVATVVVATRESREVVERRVANLLESDYPRERLRIVVAVDSRGSQCAAADLVFSDARVRIVQGDDPGGKAAALNAAMREATGEIVVFADSHHSFAADAILRLVCAANTEGFGAVSGELRLPSSTGASILHMYWKFEMWLRAQEARWHSSVGVVGPIWAIRRSLWEPLPAGLINDDVYTPMRLVLSGWRIGFDPEALAYDLRPPEVQTEGRRKVRTLTGNLQVVRALPAILDPGRNAIWMQFMLHKLARFATPILAAMALAAVPVLLLQPNAQVPLAILAATLAICAVVPPLRREVFSTLRWLSSMSSAITTGLMNGVRGEWDVWRR